MKKSRFSEEQIVGVLKEAEAGVSVKEICRRIGISDATFYHWKAKCGGTGSERGAASAPTGRCERAAEEDRGAAGVGHRRVEGGAVKKVVGPREEREAVRVARDQAGLSERHACGLIGMHRGNRWYRPRAVSRVLSFTLPNNRSEASVTSRTFFLYRGCHRSSNHASRTFPENLQRIHRQSSRPPTVGQTAVLVLLTVHALAFH
jgi:transposase-like protein